MTSNGDRSARDRVLSELREAGKLVVVAHENPDGDAIGSLVAMRAILAEIGKDCVMFIDAHDLPLPQEYRFLPLDGLVSEPPADVSERTIVFLDCGNIDRNPAEAFRGGRDGCTSSTSTTITTTPTSGRSTSSCPRRRAPPRSCGT